MSTSDTDNPAAWAGFEAPDGHELAWKVVRPNGRTRGDFQWPFKGVVKVAKSQVINHHGACPRREGDGLCLAKTWAGAASGNIQAITGLAVAYRVVDKLGEDENKLRVRACRVLGVLDIHRLLMDGRGSRANLCGADLCGANLSRANLSGANLYGANLSRANLSGADLCEADLCEANLSGANLYGAHISGVNLYGAHLSGANLFGANLCGADLYRADLSRADLSGADLYGANLSRANLSGADLYGANLFGANFSGANLYGARNIPQNAKGS